MRYNPKKTKDKKKSKKSDAMQNINIYIESVIRKLNIIHKHENSINYQILILGRRIGLELHETNFRFFYNLHLKNKNKRT